MNRHRCECSICTERGAEIDRLQEAKRRALEAADRRAKEANGLRMALKSLATEVRGVWDTFEHDIRHGISNTNYAVVRDKLEEAYRALGAVGCVEQHGKD